MSSAQLLRLAWRQCRANGRRLEWRSLAAALLIAITLSSLLAVTGARLERGLGQQSAALLGADLSLLSRRPLTDQGLPQAEAGGIRHTDVVQFTSMLNTEQQFLLVSIKAVQAPYPLRGEIDIAPAGPPLPEPGTLWAERSVLQRLGMQVGDTLEVGYQPLRISAELISAPDRGSGFGSFNPQVIINRADLDATGLLGPGARVRYRRLFAGPLAAIDQLEAELRQQLSGGERLVSLRGDGNLQGELQRNLSRYLRLSAIMALLLCALTILLSLRRFSRSNLDRAALLINMGMTAGQLLRLYGLQLLILWLGCALLGTLSACLLSQLLDWMLMQWLPALPAVPAWHYGQGALLGLALLLTLGLPPVLAVSRVSVSHLLKRQPPPPAPGGLVLSTLALLLMLAAIALYLNSLGQALLVGALLAATGLLLGYVGQWLVLYASRLLAARLQLGRLLVLRLRQQRRWLQLQIPVISLLLALMALLWLARADLMTRWQQQLPLNTANHFLINIQPWETEPLSALLDSQQVEHRLYPMVRGRLVGLNGLPPSKAFNEQQRQHNSLNRELNLTWMQTLPRSNIINAGQWPPQALAGQASISVEQQMAQQLGLELGDRLAFDIGGQRVEAVISSLRQVQWDSFQPNFYVIFSPAALDGLPVSYITSFYLPADNNRTVPALLAQFPTLTLISIEQLLAQARQVIHQLVDASALILALTLLAGAVLVITLINQELAQRRYENALLQTLGATPEECRRLTRLEFSLVGTVCGLLAAVLAELTLWPVHQQILRIEPGLHPLSWLLLPLGGWLLFSLLGRLGGRQLQQGRLLQQLVR
ncbi:ABC transporter permease [Marinobacterium arenosum]|uniref:ABC transporter permease n=1 Tax=Marinobacterium arenosum TaxID=2862496 RepID=UPI001C964653|nr:FtsX-like permease family protein [Marinobacterium arenosum]MBY4679015.1 hypothetical protein [Marinobacterium arenosum]